MRAELVAVSGNVADAELAEFWVGSGDPYGAICHRFIRGPSNLVSEVWRGAGLSVRTFPTEDVLTRGHVFERIIIESNPYKVERRFVRKSEIQMPDVCSCCGDPPQNPDSVKPE